MKTNSKPFLFNYKEALCKLFDNFLEEGKINSGSYTFYDALKEAGCINPSKEVIIEACRKARVFLLQKDSERPKNQQKPYLYNNNHNFIVKINAKALLLEDIFAKIDAEGKHLKDFLI
jgi:hypothetical protein